MSAVLPSSPSVEGAIERLTRSRERLREALLPPPPEAHGHPLGEGLGAWATDLANRAKALPGAQLLLEALHDWWAQHPLRTAGLIAAAAARKLAAPLAERSPLTLMFGAALVGALFALSRPSRWLLRPALVAGLAPALAARVIRELPIDAWLTMVSSFVVTRAPAPTPSPATAAPSAAPTMP